MRELRASIFFSSAAKIAFKKEKEKKKSEIQGSSMTDNVQWRAAWSVMPSHRGSHPM